MMNYEPLDSLPYIDTDITNEERDKIDQLIFQELQGQDISQTHPKVDEIYTLPPKSHLIAHIPEDELQQEDFTLGGINLDRYSNFEDSEALQKSIAYTYLRNVSLNLDLQLGKNQWLLANEETREVNEMIKDEVARKKRRIQDVNKERKEMQLEVKPVVDYLQERWVQGVQKNVELGVEILKLEHGVS